MIKRGRKLPLMFAPHTTGKPNISSIHIFTGIPNSGISFPGRIDDVLVSFSDIDNFIIFKQTT